MKKLFKGLIVIICLLISLSLFIFYSQNLFNNKKDTSFKVIKDRKRIDSETDIKKSNLSSNQSQFQANSKEEATKVSICLFGNFDRIEDLMKNSDLVVKGTVIATEPFVQIDEKSHGTPYTKLTFKIKNVIAGDKRLKGRTISILEYGGEISKKDFGLDQKFKNLSKTELNEKLNISFEGFLKSNIGQSNIVFLVDENESNLESKLYGIQGVYKGKFIQDYNTGKYIRGTLENATKEMEETELRINNAVTELNNQLES